MKHTQRKTGAAKFNRLRQILRFTTFAMCALLFAGFAGAARAADGDVDATFSAAVDNGGVGATVVQTDGKILIGGTFTSVSGAARPYVARLNADGSLDQTFNASAGIGASGNNVVSAIALQSDGKILVGGVFSASSGQTNVARLNADGSLDAGFTATANGQVNAVVLQPNGNVLIGGVFTTVNAAARERVAQLTSSGVLTAFSVAFNNPTSSTRIRGIALQPDGKVLINGLFDILSGGNRRLHLARLNADGTLDASFDIGFISSATVGGAVAVQPDGRVLAIVSHADTSRFGLARYSASGQLETAFNPTTNANNSTFAFYLQPDGKIVVGGSFTAVNGAARNRIARLNADGTLDASFTTSADASVSQITAQTDGKILIGGSFTTVNGTARQRIARLANAATAAKKTVLDFDGDGKSDFVVVRAADANSQAYWLINNGANLANFTSVPFGLGVRGFGFQPPADIAMPEDFDGDGRTDVAVFRPTGYGDSSRSYFFILQSNGNVFRAEQFGSQGDNPTVSADYDGDKKADIAVYRDGAAGAQSYWFYRPSATAGVEFRSIPWGSGGDFVAPGDYDGDGRADVCVYRNAGNNVGQFILSRSSDGATEYVNWGVATDQINPGDYDNDGKTDFMLTRNVNGNLVWYLLTRTGGGTGAGGIYFGVSSDFTVQGDYDGDGKTDVAVWRRTDGTFYVLRSRDGFQAFQWGQRGDYPVGYYNAH